MAMMGVKMRICDLVGARSILLPNGLVLRFSSVASSPPSISTVIPMHVRELLHQSWYVQRPVYHSR
jgi:hypothetical protein